MVEQAGDSPSPRDCSGGVESKQEEDMPEKPKVKGKARHYWLFDEIDTLSEILRDRLRESRIGRRLQSIDWESVTKEYNARSNGCFQKKGTLMRDGETGLRKGRYAPNRTRQQIYAISTKEPRLNSILAEYNDTKEKRDSGIYEDLSEETDSDMNEDSVQIEIYEGDQSPPRLFKWKGVRYIDNNDRTEAEVHRPDKSKSIIEYIALFPGTKEKYPEHLKLSRVLFKYEPKLSWNSEVDVIALNNWRKIMLHRTSGVRMKREKVGPGLTHPWSRDEQQRLANILTKQKVKPSLGEKNYSGVDYPSVAKEFNDSLGFYRSETQIKEIIRKKDLSKLTDDYINEEEKKRIGSANATALAFAKKRSRISSSGGSQ